MESSMFSIGNLKTMEVIDVSSGTKLGFVKDLKIDCTDYKIVSIILPEQKMSWFGKGSEIEVPWSDVVKIGVDVILIDGTNLSLVSKE